ncbi:MAG: nucleoside recognition domain-containing protein [Chthoniobacteraceae bacterium]
MLNYIWLSFLLVAVFWGGFTGRLPEVTEGAFNMGKTAVMDLALPLVGLMAIWLGMMRLAEMSGLVQVIARVLKPGLRRLFPDVPADHPAMGAMVMNMSANMLGLGNAATPLGLRAMTLLEKLNPRPGIPTNAMVTFLVINTASIQLVPTTAISWLVLKGSANPAAIVPTAILATLCAFIVGITVAKVLERTPWFRLEPAALPQAGQAGIDETGGEREAAKVSLPPMTLVGGLVLTAYFIGFAMIFYVLMRHPTAQMEGQAGVLKVLFAISILAVPFLLSFFPLYAAVRGVKVYSEFTEGAKESFPVALRIIPFLVAMLVAIGMLRESGFLKSATDFLTPMLSTIGFPADLLPMVLMRPLSGSGTQGLFVDLISRTGEGFGPDSLISRMAGTIYGSTETTFYVLAVYFGSVAIRQSRHAIIAGLSADLTAVIASVVICRLMFA